MTRSYRGVRPIRHRVYTVEEVMALYGVSRNTVTNWMKSGLKPSDPRQPYLFRGAVLAEYHADRRARAKSCLRPGEFKCLGCKTAVLPEPMAINRRPASNGNTLLAARCPDCDAHVTKLASKADMALLDGKGVPNTTLDSRHEGKQRSLARIVKLPAKDSAKVYLMNDRLLASWQQYAQRYSVKTQDRHLAAIRKFEDSVGGKPFSKLVVEDVSRFRSEQRKSLGKRGGKGRSKSTVSHTLSHLRDFLTWLLKQPGHDGLPKDLPDYLELSRADYATALQTAPREYLSIGEAEELLQAMPTRTLADRRSRSLFALAFLGALRADTLTSLQLRHVRVDEKQIIQDARVSRTKNGKSLIVCWFPIPSSFGEVVADWVRELIRLGARPEDALFPDSSWLRDTKQICKVDRDLIPCMESTHAVSRAFRIACQHSEVSYTPHSARHTIAALRDELPLTRRQRKAWADNMGHKNENTTEVHYGKIPEAQRFELLSSIEDFGQEGGLRIPAQERQQLEEAYTVLSRLLDR